MDFDRLDAILKKRGISRRKLALAIGLNENTMASAFKRRRGLSSDDVLKIAKFLNVNPFFLEGISDDQSNEDFWDMVNYGIEEIDEVRFSTLTAAYRNLNKEGQIEAVKRVVELTEVPRYTKQDEQGDSNGQG